MNNRLNLLTVDMEEWFVVEALADRVSFEDWDSHSSTLVRNSRRLLNLFSRKGVHATWFILGWCAEKHREIVAEIADAGHEIGCHSYRHRKISSLSPEEFREDTLRAQEAIVSAAGVTPVGYRAPSWSITPESAWAFDILAELGFQYDSSLFPIKHDLYGIPGGPREIFKMKTANNRYLWEIPASTYRTLGRNIPLGGGGYLRHSPYWYSRWMINKLNAQHVPVVVYIHPWEIDPEPPFIDGLSASQRFRTYGSTDTFEVKLERLLEDFEFVCASDYLAATATKKIGFERD